MPCSKFGIARNPGILSTEAAEAYEMTGSRLKSLRPFAEFASAEQRHAEREREREREILYIIERERDFIYNRDTQRERERLYI